MGVGAQDILPYVRENVLAAKKSSLGPPWRQPPICACFLGVFGRPPARTGACRNSFMAARRGFKPGLRAGFTLKGKQRKKSSLIRIWSQRLIDSLIQLIGQKPGA